MLPARVLELGSTVFSLKSRNPLMLDTGNVLLSYRKSYFGSPLPYLKYFCNVSFAVFKPYPYMVRISNSRFQVELNIRNALLSIGSHI